AVNVSLAEVWKSLGVVPGAVVGHSQGEIAAAAVAGALSLEDAARVVALRAQVIARVLAGLGGMASIPLPRTEVEARLADWPGRLDVAAVNGPNSTVISGDADAIVEFVAACQAEDIRARQVPVDYASHSAHVERIEAELLDVLAPITPRPAQIPFYSTVEGAVIDTAGVDAAYWYRNLRQTVRFDDVTRLLIADGYTTFVESSAHPVLTIGIQETADVIATGTLRRNEGTLARFLTSAAELHTQGAPIDWTAFFTPYQPKQVDLPTYAFQRKRFWLEDTAPEITASAEVSGGSDAVDARFWAAVEREDWQTLVGALDTDPDVPLGVVLPALAEWRRERRREATVDSWRYGLDWRPVSEPGTPAALSGTWLVVTPEGYVHDPSVATARAALVARGAQILSVVVSATDAERGLYAATLAEILETAEGQSPAGVLSFLALDERPHAAHPSMVSGVAATLALVQALGDVELDIPLWLATRGAVATGGTDRVTSPLQAQVWGLGRVVALEQPRRWGGLVDLPESLDERAQARLAAVLAGLDGEDQVAVRASGVLARRLVRTPGPAVDDSLAPGGTWRSRGTAVVTGGTGALGPLIARWLADSGTEHVVLTSRRGPAAPGMAELQTELADRGSRLTVAACDAADRDQIAALLAGLKADGETVRTVIHAAAFIELASLAESGLGEFADVLAAKVNGARYFDELLDDADLDAFVLFSSIAGVWGSGDHGAYAASNAYLDALAEQRRARGLKAASIAWGVWNVWDPDRLPDGVKPEQLQARGLPFIDPATAFVAMRQVIERDETFVAVADVDWDRFVPVFTSAGPRPLLTGVPEARQILEAAVRPAQQAGLPTAERAESPASPLAQRLAALATPAERDRALLDLVRAQAAAVLGHASADEIQPGRAFRELGFESLTSVELRNRLNTATGLRLPATLLFDHPTPSALAALLRDELLGSQAETTAPAAPAAAAAPPAADDDPIAIVAMSCRFPGGLHTPEQLWEVLTAGEETLSELPVNRGWDIDGIYDPDPEQHGKTYTRHGGFLHDADEFDPGFFGISPREALAMDPQQRILLETSWEAFERAGIDPQSLRGSRTAVFAGVSYHDYGSRLREAPEDVEGYLGTGNTASIASGRVSYILGLEGPAVTLDTGCSSSLVALHLAVQALRQGESDLALAGGVSVMAIPASFTEFSRQRGLSVDGRCRAFSADADGMGMSEGAGLVLLERLSDARRNGHRVLALVRGTATNQDGASNGLTAPNGPSQQRVIRQALASAGLSAAEVDAVEAHGTGTKLGDPIEAQALLATYGQDRDPQQPLFLGSVKSNIGHTQAASGAAGLIKMVLALQHGVLPKSLHIGEPTPQVDWEAGAVELLSEERVWPETGRPRRAGVSSFGISGTNAHTVIEQAPSVEEEPAPVTEAPVAGAVPWLVSARTETALRAQAERLLAFAEAHPELSPVDIGHSLATGRSAFEQRAAVIGHDRTELLDALRALTEDGGAPNLVRGTATEAGMTTFVFPGQGTQWVGMAASLLEESSVFAGRMGECAAALAPFVDFDLVQVIREAQDLDRVDVIQPVTWAVNVSLAEVWKSLGVVPGAVVGHSQGEIAAAAVAGALSLEDAARVVALRAQVIARVLAGLGGMASIPLPRTQVEARLADWTGRLDVAAVNGPNSTVISGDADAIVEFVAACQAEDIRARQVPVDYASHSAHVERIEAELLDVLAPITPRPAQIPFYSTVEGAVIDTAGVDAAYWYRNLRQTVRFDDVTRLLIADGYTTFIESSAHPVLTIGIQETADVIATGTLRRNEGTLARFLTSAAELHTQGAPIDWTAFFTPYQPKQADLPTYAFQRQRYWLEDTAGETTDVTAAGLVSAQHPLLGAAVPLADSDGFLLTGRLSLRTHPWLADHAVAGTVLLPGTGFVELAVRAADQAGCETVEELTLAAPLILPAHGAIDVQLNVSGADDSGRRSLSLYSRPESADAAEPWTRHATGVLAESAPTASPDGTTDGTPHADLGAWPPPGAEPIDIDGYYERLTTQGYGYGPSFQGLRAAWRGGDEVFDEVFAEVALPAEAADGADGFGIHPALLDAALHGLGLGLLPSAGEGRARLPFSWNGVTLHASGATALRVRITQLGEEDAVSITVADTTGRPVASVESLVVRQVVTDQLKVADPTVGQSLFRPDWVRIDTPGAQAAGSSWAVLGDDPLGLTGLGWHAYPDLASLAAAGAVPDVVFASFTAAPETASAEGAHGAVQRALELVRQWLADERLESSRLVLLTRRAVATGPGSPVGDVALTDAPVWGLLRSAQSEHPGRFLLIDVDGGTESLAALPAAVAAGEPQIAVRNGRPHALRLTRAELTNTEDAAAFGPDSTVLVTGASGTLGGLVARHLVERHGVRRLVLVSRRPADELARALRELGAEAVVAACDVADRRAVWDVLAAHTITAVVHTAGTIDDGVVESLTPERVAGVLRPKVDGALNLHELTAGSPLTAFVLFSSAAGVFGGPGQGGYAAANAFLDALAHDRRAQGLPAVSLGWGFWEERSGLTAHLDRTDLHRMNRLGVHPMTSQEGLALLDAAVATGQPHLLPMRLDVAALRRTAAGADVPALLRGLIRSRTRRTVQTAPGTSGPADAGSLRERLAGMTPPERTRTLEELVVTRVAAVLGHGSAEMIEPQRAFKELGFDSLTAVELRNRLRAATGLRLPATLVFDHPTPAAIAQHLAVKLLPDLSDGPGRPADTTPLPDATDVAALTADPGTGAQQALDSLDAMDLDQLVNLALDGTDGTDAAGTDA
ncbi:SDR family NAD(P)-dependent oxidoreductase, partial [Streptomyces sp. NPDC020298]|uniref:SDR family NAD(P)-dependent oxidoreductase n=1 Tax=Streptomyces sp. NPDC020298 TaxID=3155010 RepID=UPI0033F940E2